jgi:MOSC domain-containing protein YiiM
VNGTIEGLFVYPEEGGEPQPLQSARIVAGIGLEGDQTRTAHRAVTVLSLDQWRETMRDLGADMPPQTRRANVIVSGIDLPATMGKRLRLGDAEIEVLGEVKPCGQMEAALAGLKQALAREWRGGVHGRVVREGALHVGDAVTVNDSA